MVANRNTTSSPARLALGALLASACIAGAWVASEGAFWPSAYAEAAPMDKSCSNCERLDQGRRNPTRSQASDPSTIALDRDQAIVLLVLALSGGGAGAH
jgi:hypothetical protein